MKYNVPFIKPSFPSAEKISRDYELILSSNWFTNFGPFEKKFANKVGEYVGNDYTGVTFSNATAALIATILATLGKGDGTKYILLPSFTFAAGAHAIIWCGYKPLFIDIERIGLHMDIKVAKAALEDKNFERKIVGILFCNSFGVGATNIDEWEELSKSMDLPLIIDSAAGFGSQYTEEKMVGSAGAVEVFSFHATKPFAIGEGGASVTRNKAIADKLYSVQNFGFDKNKNATGLGFNAKMQELNAAIGLRQFESFKDTLINRRKTFRQYLSILDKKKYTLQHNAELASLCFAAVIVNDTTKRDKVLSALKEVGVEVKTYYSPTLHEQKYFSSLKCYSPLYNTQQISNSILSLPIHDNMREQDIDLITTTLNNN